MRTPKQIFEVREIEFLEMFRAHEKLSEMLIRRLLDRIELYGKPTQIAKTATVLREHEVEKGFERRLFEKIYSICEKISCSAAVQSRTGAHHARSISPLQDAHDHQKDIEVERL